MESRTLLATKNLQVGFAIAGQPHCLLMDLHLKLESGKLVCLMGSNGVGKSTLLKTLAGLMPAQGGQIHINTARPAENIAVVLTGRVQHPHLLVKELVGLGRYPYLDWRAKLTDYDHRVIQSVIKLVGIGALSEKKINELSDGQMQMAMIARALAQETPVLLLDEPTAHLDLNNRVEIMNMLKRLARETNRAVLMATHELDLALQTADEIWLASSAKTIKVGIPEDLVLDGSFDAVFQFKGFDLKTGRVEHPVTQSEAINLIGEGHAFLWTKNALERNGYQVHGTGTLTINIIKQETGISWELGGTYYDSLQALLKTLK